MVLNAKQRQKKLQRKAKKRKESLARRPQAWSRTKASAYASFPIHECLLPEELFEIGLGNVIVARKTPQGKIALGAFLVDVFCLGVKNAFFHLSDEHDYENRIKARLIESHAGRDFENIHPSCARKLIEGAVAYAEALGFRPHPDYRDAKSLFGDIDPGACPEKFTFGQDGKPFYVRGPSESPSKARRIVQQLHRKCGEDGYHYMVEMDELF